MTQRVLDIEVVRVVENGDDIVDAVGSSCSTVSSVVAAVWRDGDSVQRDGGFWHCNDVGHDGWFAVDAVMIIVRRPREAGEQER